MTEQELEIEVEQEVNVNIPEGTPIYREVDGVLVQVYPQTN